jgi:hypothetical protein
LLQLKIVRFRPADCDQIIQQDRAIATEAVVAIVEND